MDTTNDEFLKSNQATSSKLENSGFDSKLEIRNSKLTSENEGEVVCDKCGSVKILEDGKLICPHCDTVIDYFGEDDENDTNDTK
jgi:hypothetical protein